MTPRQHALILAGCLLLAGILLMVIRPVGQGGTDTYPTTIVRHQ